MTRPLNPFDPSRPIDPNKFVGRHKEIRELEAALLHTKNDKPRHFLITGERGVGKTSFFDYLRRRASNVDGTDDFNFAVVDFAVNKKTTKLDFARALRSQLDGLLAKNPTNLETMGRVWGFLQRFEVAGVAYRGDEQQENHREMYLDVADSLFEVVKRICTADDGELNIACDGVLVLVDEVDQSNEELDIGTFLKYLLEQLNRKGCHKVVIGLAGLTHTTDVLLNSHASALRIFDELALSNLSRNDVKELLREIESLVWNDGVGDFKISEAASEMLFELSGGHPHMLHQLGYCAFEAACNAEDADGFSIEASHVMTGFVETRGALDLIGDMYFRKPFELIEASAPALAILDHLSEKGGSESVSEIAKGAALIEADARSSVELLVRNGMLARQGAGSYGIKHPAFAYWVKANRPPPEY